MPTANHWYNMAAQKWGKVDPTNEKAVEEFFTQTFPTLPEKRKEAVLEFLLGREGPSKVPKGCPCSGCEKKRKREAKRLT